MDNLDLLAALDYFEFDPISASPGSDSSLPSSSPFRIALSLTQAYSDQQQQQLQRLHENDLFKIWNVVSRHSKVDIDNGPRLENIAWRMLAKVGSSPNDPGNNKPTTIKRRGVIRDLTPPSISDLPGLVNSEDGSRESLNEPNESSLGGRSSGASVGSLGGSTGSESMDSLKVGVELNKPLLKEFPLKNVSLKDSNGVLFSQNNFKQLISLITPPHPLSLSELKQKYNDYNAVHQKRQSRPKNQPHPSTKKTKPTKKATFIKSISKPKKANLRPTMKKKRTNLKQEELMPEQEKKLMPKPERTPTIQALKREDPIPSPPPASNSLDFVTCSEPETIDDSDDEGQLSAKHRTTSVVRGFDLSHVSVSFVRSRSKINLEQKNEEEGEKDAQRELDDLVGINTRANSRKQLLQPKQQESQQLHSGPSGSSLFVKSNIKKNGKNMFFIDSSVSDSDDSGTVGSTESEIEITHPHPRLQLNSALKNTAAPNSPLSICSTHDDNDNISEDSTSDWDSVEEEINEPETSNTLSDSSFLIRDDLPGSTKLGETRSSRLSTLLHDRQITPIRRPNSPLSHIRSISEQLQPPSSLSSSSSSMSSSSLSSPKPTSGPLMSPLNLLGYSRQDGDEDENEDEDEGECKDDGSFSNSQGILRRTAKLLTKRGLYSSKSTTALCLLDMAGIEPRQLQSQSQSRSQLQLQQLQQLQPQQQPQHETKPIYNSLSKSSVNLRKIFNAGSSGHSHDSSAKMVSQLAKFGLKKLTTTFGVGAGGGNTGNELTKSPLSSLEYSEGELDTARPSDTVNSPFVTPSDSGATTLRPSTTNTPIKKSSSQMNENCGNKADQDNLADELSQSLKRNIVLQRKLDQTLSFRNLREAPGLNSDEEVNNFKFFARTNSYDNDDDNSNNGEDDVGRLGLLRRSQTDVDMMRLRTTAKRKEKHTDTTIKAQWKVDMDMDECADFNYHARGW